MIQRFFASFDYTRLIYPILILLLFVSSYLIKLPDFFVHIPLLLAIIPIAYEAYNKLKNKIVGTELFLVFATIIALIGHEERAITVVLLIMLFAEFLEHLIEDRTEGAIKSLIKLIPTDVLVKVEKEEYYLPIEKVKLGMSVVVKTGNRIPVDGEIIYGSASIDESSLTGESKLIDKTRGNSVWAGTFVQEGSIIVEVKKIGEDTFFGKIQKLLEESDVNKAKIAALADKIALFLVPSVLIFILIVWFITGNIKLVVTLLVFGSPLELTLITPLAVLSGVVCSFRRGILVKGGIALERMAYIDTIVFDKTGTITMGHPTIAFIEIFDKNYSEDEIIKIAATAEKHSAHSFAYAILEKAKKNKIDVEDPKNYISITGHGVSITYKSNKFYLGNRHFIESPEHGNVKVDLKSCGLQNDIYSSIYLANQTHLLARFCIEDVVRLEAKKTVNYFKQNSINLIMLSGDKQEVVDHIAKPLKIDKAYGNMLPDQKLKYVQKLENTHKVAMVGDGINDAPALKAAYVGIALGGMGMEPAIEAADVVLMQNDLFNIVFVHKLSKQVLKVIKQNIFIGFALIHGIGIALAFLGIITPVQAALFHAIPDLSILINSARLINFKG